MCTQLTRLVLPRTEIDTDEGLSGAEVLHPLQWISFLVTPHPGGASTHKIESEGEWYRTYDRSGTVLNEAG